jgi:hypothetical protein
VKQAWHTRAAVPHRARIGVLLAMAGALAACEPQAQPPAPASEVALLDLPAEIAELERSHPDQTDLSRIYLSTPGGSAHLHVMGREQTTPLHVHRAADEATLIVSGRARVLQIWGRDGKLQRRVETHGPGWLIHSPPLTGHEWVNPDPREAVANLVFSVPPFQGNLYVRPDDPRLLQGGEPARLQPTAELAAFAASGEGQRLVPLPLPRHTLSLLLLADRYSLAPAPPRPVLGYVLAGRIAVAGQRVVEAGTLLRFDGRGPLELRAEGDGPAALLLFDPERPADAG